MTGAERLAVERTKEMYMKQLLDMNLKTDGECIDVLDALITVSQQAGIELIQDIEANGLKRSDLNG